mmetsp:Transcript_25269/g.63611  ORF Transcript_25269/g.63611 Transcript_25269/m.63611 type:complete len:105 (+) Transcript_25269:277-591(+)
MKLNNVPCCAWFCLLFRRRGGRQRTLEELHSQPAFEKAHGPSDELIRGMLKQAEQRKSQGQHRCSQDRNALVLFDSASARAAPVGRPEASKSPPRTASVKTLDK